ERLPHAVPQGGISSAADDLARFGQAFLDGGRPLLSRAAVAQMTRDQVPGVDALVGDERRPNASWGLGWAIGAPGGGRYAPGLDPPRVFGHGGIGGSYLWGNPDDGIVGVYLSVAVRNRPDGLPSSNAD